MSLMEKEAVLLLFMVAVCGLCMGSVFKVGDSAGWTIIGKVDYTRWAFNKTFQVGDTLFFEYDPRYHNVLEVSRSDFHTCDTTNPIATYTTGNDSVVLRSTGHYYFTCGFVGHCQAGQKVDARVPKLHWPNAGPVPSPTQAPNQSSVPATSHVGPPVSGPSSSSGQSLLSCNSLFCPNVGPLLALIWAAFI